MKSHDIDEILNEHEHQSLLMNWVASSTGKYPELKWYYAIPNGAKLPYSVSSTGKRYSREASRLKAEGLKNGISDTCLPVSRGGYHGLYIELKDLQGKPTPDQIAFIRFLIDQHYFACVCKGWQAARNVLEWYLNLPRWLPEPCAVSIHPDAIVDFSRYDNKAEKSC